MGGLGGESDGGPDDMRRVVYWDGGCRLGFY